MRAEAEFAPEFRARFFNKMVRLTNAEELAAR
jgi:hypothetical protein